MTRPNIQIPKEFAINGEKADFTQEKIQTGFDKLNPDIFAGDNANKLIDDTYKGLNGVLDLYNGVVLHEMTTTYDDKAVVGKFIENSFKLYHSLVNDNIGHEVTETEYWEEVKLGGGSGLEVCDIGMALYVDETKGLRRYLNGQIVDINTNTQAFLDRLKQITTLYPSLLCTEEEWQTAKTMSAFGQVGKFVFNYSGDKVVSVRVPRVVNIQGLFDLQNLGLTVEAGLPNILATWNSTREDSNRGVYNGDSGAVSTTYNSTYAMEIPGNPGGGCVTRTFNASNSNPIYGNSDTVQPEAIQYPYFIQIATGQETENNIVNDIELNNPYSLFDSKYSDHELNNLSWLKSEGQWNAKSVYTDTYNKILENVNNCVKGFLGQTMYMWGSSSGGYMTTSLTPVVGSVVYSYGSKKLVGYVTEVDLTIPAVSIRDDVGGVSYTNVGRYTPSDESSSAYITDYDFVLNTAEETFRLPLLDGSEDLVSDTRIDFTEFPYIAPKNGLVYISFLGANSSNSILVNGNSFVYNQKANSYYGCAFTVPVCRGDVVTYSGTLGGDNRFYPYKGNGSLYYYVGETVQNANLIDAGRIGEQLATKTNMLQAAAASMPSGRYVELTLGASNSAYIAPADGYVSIKKDSTDSGQILGIYTHSVSKNQDLQTMVVSSGSGQGLSVYMPVAKGETFNVFYGVAGTLQSFKFFYAQGAK